MNYSTRYLVNASDVDSLVELVCDDFDYAIESLHSASLWSQEHNGLIFDAHDAYNIAQYIHGYIQFYMKDTMSIFEVTCLVQEMCIQVMIDENVSNIKNNVVEFYL